MTTMFRHRLSVAAHSSRSRPLAVVGFSALSLVAACGGSSSPSNGPTASASASVSTTPSSVASTSAPTTVPTTEPTTAAPTPSATTVAGLAGCRSIHLALQAGQSQGAAGSTIATFILRNAGTTACSLLGFPGVSFLNASGVQLGAAAIRQGNAGARLIVQPGQVASFQVQIAVAGCAPNSVQSTTIRVYPPNQKAALEAPAAFPICAVPSVTAVVSGIPQ